MMSLFSSFDLFYHPMIYLLLIFFSFNFMCTIMKVSSMTLILGAVQHPSLNFFSSLSDRSSSKSISNLLTSLGLLLFFFNFVSVLSFTFPLNSQLSSVLSLGLTFWVSYILFSVLKNAKGFISHCIPDSTPLILVPLMFSIELVSQIIRPVTLSVRMTANILAGHLLMNLLSSLALSSMSGAFFYTFLNLVELFVSVIQSFIFATMLKLYYSEV
uniref:ATP synthase subunit a n=1 Tax=Epitrimerus sabinae TaxID=1452570 RepID=A0A0U2NR29_9ACAR|nr:ATP synthase F0 subunit 6 [Epitrimerus sabinae]ALK03786.1 ATP synthase subunit 6 [Epitrimerus sabinae]